VEELDQVIVSDQS